MCQGNSLQLYAVPIIAVYLHLRGVVRRSLTVTVALYYNQICLVGGHARRQWVLCGIGRVG